LTTEDTEGTEAKTFAPQVASGFRAGMKILG